MGGIDVGQGGGNGEAARLARRASAAFTELAGRPCEGVWVAPGRVNLIGEHLDYNGGHVLPFAIDRAAALAVGRRADDAVRCWSMQEGAAVETTLERAGEATGWSAYLLGVLWAFLRRGIELTGLDLVLDSSVPLGSGMSSSAALECAAALALDELTGAGLDRRQLAAICQLAENEIVGAPVGIMDQRASLDGVAGHALFLDCRSGRGELLPLDLEGAELSLLVVDTGIRHRHAEGAYRRRRDDCEEAARLLGVDSLAEAGEADVERLLSNHPRLRRRAHHVVGEERRVVRAAELLRRGSLAELGPLLSASHRSLRDDFEVSVAELDAVVDAALGAGALGARLTGGGFGGAAIVLVQRSRRDEVARAAAGALGGASTDRRLVEEVRPADGAHREL